MNLAIGKAIVNEAFKSRNWKFSLDDTNDNYIVFDIEFLRDESTEMDCRVIVFDTGICDIEQILPFTCPDDYQYMLVLYLTHYNYLKRYATYRLNIENGEITYSYSYNFNEASTPAEFLEKFDIVANIDSDEYSKIENICLTGSAEKGDVLIKAETSEKYKISL